MINCDLCLPNREFESEIAYNIHKEEHHKSEQEVIKELEQQENDKKLVESFNNLDEVKKQLEVNKMGLFSKEDSKQEIEMPPQFNEIRSYLFELHLEVVDKQDKKAFEVIEEINKTILSLMSKGYDVVLKLQRTEKQF